MYIFISTSIQLWREILGENAGDIYLENIRIRSKNGQIMSVVTFILVRKIKLKNYPQKQNQNAQKLERGSEKIR